jgi:5-methylcytosine-specific restriction endonuclease McrA
MKVEKLCENCNEPFITDTRETNRNKGKYCSRNCGAIKSNLNRLVITSHICKQCGIEFNAESKHAKYCSYICKIKNYRLKKRTDDYSYTLEQTIKEYPCEICQWQECSRDVHHIISVSEGGKSEINNLISLCPNHHRLADRKLLLQDYLFEIIKSRTISSSLESLLIKIASKEQGAVLVIKETIIPPVVSEPS